MAPPFSEEVVLRLKDTIKRTLVKICEADPSVLCDYIIALLHHDMEASKLRAFCCEQLEDFLREDTHSFVDGLFNLLAEASGETKQGAEPIGEDVDMEGQTSDAPQVSSESYEKESKTQSNDFYPEEQNKVLANAYVSSAPDIPSLPPGVTERSNGLASRQQYARPQYSTKRPCFDFRNSGSCNRPNCPYEHIIQSTPMQPRGPYVPRHSNNGRARLQPRESLILDKIPRELFNEDLIGEYFSRFGNVKIKMISENPYERRAIVTFPTVEECQSAFECPDAVLGNRFVRIHYYVPDTERERDYNSRNRDRDGERYRDRTREYDRERERERERNRERDRDRDREDKYDNDGQNENGRNRDRDRPGHRSPVRNGSRYAGSAASFPPYSHGIYDDSGEFFDVHPYGYPADGMSMFVPHAPFPHMGYPVVMPSAYAPPYQPPVVLDEKTLAEVAEKKANMLRDLRDLQARLKVKIDDPTTTEEARTNAKMTLARVTRQIATLIEEVHADPVSDSRELAKLREERKRERLDRELDDIASDIRKTDGASTEIDDKNDAKNGTQAPRAPSVSLMPPMLPRTIARAHMMYPMSIPMGLPHPSMMPAQGPGVSSGSSQVWVSERPRFSLDLRPSTLQVTGVPNSRRDEIELLMRSFGEVATTVWSDNVGDEAANTLDNGEQKIDDETSVTLEVKYVTRGYAEKALVTASQRKSEFGDEIVVAWKK